MGTTEEWEEGVKGGVMHNGVLWDDVVITHIDHRLPLWQRLKVLLGYPVTIRVFVYTEKRTELLIESDLGGRT